mgnify:CR=1 FL=1
MGMSDKRIKQGRINTIGNSAYNVSAPYFAQLFVAVKTVPGITHNLAALGNMAQLLSQF